MLSRHGAGLAGVCPEGGVLSRLISMGVAMCSVSLKDQLKGCGVSAGWCSDQPSWSSTLTGGTMFESSSASRKWAFPQGPCWGDVSPSSTVFIIMGPPPPSPLQHRESPALCPVQGSAWSC